MITVPTGRWTSFGRTRLGLEAFEQLRRPDLSTDPNRRLVHGRRRWWRWRWFWQSAHNTADDAFGEAALDTTRHTFPGILVVGQLGDARRLLEWSDELILSCCRSCLRLFRLRLDGDRWRRWRRWCRHRRDKGHHRRNFGQPIRHIEKGKQRHDCDRSSLSDCREQKWYGRVTREVFLSSCNEVEHGWTPVERR